MSSPQKLTPEEVAWMNCLAVELNRAPCMVPWLSADAYILVSRMFKLAGCNPDEAATAIRILNKEVEETVRLRVQSATNASFN